VNSCSDARGLFPLPVIVGTVSSLAKLLILKPAEELLAGHADITVKTESGETNYAAIGTISGAGETHLAANGAISGVSDVHGDSNGAISKVSGDYHVAHRAVSEACAARACSSRSY
jgi:hypothetical protein